MKTPIPDSAADGLIRYLHANNSILTDQGINVRAFIERLSAFKGGSASSQASTVGIKSKARKRAKG